MTRRRVLFLSLALLAGAVTALVGGCSPDARRRILSTIFEGLADNGQAPRPKPVVRKPRRPPAPAATPARLVVVTPPEAPPPPAPAPAPAWAALSARLPKDAAGGIDWARAFREKAIEPRPGLDPAAVAPGVLPLDVERVPAGQPVFRVVFPHEPHTQVLACDNCHTGIFEMRRGAAPITMAAIYAGEFCGRCHGKVAFAVPTGCPRCHPALAAPAAASPAAPRAPAVERLRSWEEVAAALPKDAAGGVDWAKALAEEAIAPRAALDAAAPAPPPLNLDVVREPAGQPAFRAVFPHLPHTRWLACANCHPAIFQMRRGAAAISMGSIFGGQHCGACHGKVAFDVATGCARCHPAMGGSQ